MNWQPIETAPKDGREILAFLRPAGSSSECGYCGGASQNLCLYHAHAEGLAQCNEDFAIVQWGGGWVESDWESPQHNAEMPDWWFRAGSEFEEAANPTHWMPLPDPPEAAP